MNVGTSIEKVGDDCTRKARTRIGTDLNVPDTDVQIGVENMDYH